MASFSRKSLITFCIMVFVLLLIPVLIFYQPDRHPGQLMDRYGLHCSELMQVQGMEVHICAEGEGTPLLLLHGTGASLHTWTDWAMELRKEYRVIRVDIPGFGLTGPHTEADYSAASYVSFVNALADSLSLGRFHLGGNSLGGMIAWQYAAAHPDRLLSLLLIDPSGIPMDKEPPLALRLAQSALTKPVVRHLTPRFLVRSSLEEVYYYDSLVEEDLVQRYFDLLLRDGNRQAFIDRANTPYTYDSTLLEKITAPTLVMWGEQDVWIPVGNASTFDRLISDAQIHVFDSAGHVPMEEIPERSVKVYNKFLQLHQSADSVALR